MVYEEKRNNDKLPTIISDRNACRSCGMALQCLHHRNIGPTLRNGILIVLCENVIAHTAHHGNLKRKSLSNSPGLSLTRVPSLAAITA
jgi:hypothetical protein